MQAYGRFSKLVGLAVVTAGALCAGAAGATPPVPAESALRAPPASHVPAAPAAAAVKPGVVAPATKNAPDPHRPAWGTAPPSQNASASMEPGAGFPKVIHLNPKAAPAVPKAALTKAPEVPDPPVIRDAHGSVSLAGAKRDPAAEPSARRTPSWTRGEPIPGAPVVHDVGNQKVTFYESPRGIGVAHQDGAQPASPWRPRPLVQLTDRTAKDPEFFKKDGQNFLRYRAVDPHGKAPTELFEQPLSADATEVAKAPNGKPLPAVSLGLLPKR